MIDSRKVVAAQKKAVDLWHEKEEGISSWDDAVRLVGWEKGDLAGEIALINSYQWHEEDKSRATDASDAVLAQVKRNIDLSNARRVNAIERLDQSLEEVLALKPGAPLNSETPGSMVDRISILILKIHHMSEHARREGLSTEQRKKFADKLRTLKEQLKDLSACLDGLMKEAAAGRRRFKTYFQHKMYNDPETNPYIKTPR